ncbi:glycerophosphodiester phosphodiesterase [Paenibacillus methanolicus]|uniref:Glycerophosphoryl diester phosphodiesterase n=1 Tax=Paenibacillus methanolicus TaxID=582686 RepID=A0A5S5C242_9BACL|nr:glycerophosphodiester phosphodiesterase family protein [Paenibacillus methanolicus]TYP73229.1 glycerophosphoryl diester phosphodiesterase [Paenibacillus methanolicus]
MRRAKRMSLLRAGAAGLAAAATVLVLTSFMLSPRLSEGITVIAHRGASGFAPENTMAAFELAVEMKADYLELDVHLSKDGELVVLHDETLERTTDGVGLVKDHTWAELSALDAGSKYEPAFHDERIPLLREVMDRYAGRIGILIELKKTALYPGIEEKLAELIEDYDVAVAAGRDGREAPVMIQSFDRESVRFLAQRLPDIPRAVLVHPDEHPLSADTLTDLASYADYINCNFEELDRGLVRDIHAQGRKVMAWTLRDEREMERIARLGVDGIITDYPVWGYEGNSRHTSP